MLKQYTRRQAGLNPWTKALTRTAVIEPARLRPEFRGSITHPHHGWDHETSPAKFRTVDVLGGDMNGYWPNNEAGFAARFENNPTAIQAVFDEALIHHYAFRSEADFQRRVERGLGGDFGNQAQWGRRGLDGTAADLLAELNEVEDLTLAQWWTRHLKARTSTLDMYGPRPLDPLISRDRPCQVSSIWTAEGENLDRDQALGAVDGRAIVGRHAFHTAVEDRPWFTVDLEERHLVSEVRLYNRMDMAEVVARSAKIGISVSDDGRSWRSVFRKNDTRSFGGANGFPLTWRPDKPVGARFVRVELLVRGILHLEQVEVYGRRP